MEGTDHETYQEALLVRFENPEVRQPTRQKLPTSSRSEFCRWDEYHLDEDILHNDMISLINCHVPVFSKDTHHGSRGQGQGKRAEENMGLGQFDQQQQFSIHEPSLLRYTDIEVMKQIEKTVQEERENAFKYTDEDIELIKITERKVQEERQNSFRYASEDIEIMKQVERKVQEERQIASKRHLNGLKDAVPVKRSRLQGCAQSFPSNNWNDGVFGCPEVNRRDTIVHSPLSMSQQNTSQENSRQCWSGITSMLDSEPQCLSGITSMLDSEPHFDNNYVVPSYDVDNNLHEIMNNGAYFDKQESGQFSRLKEGLEKVEGQFAYTSSKVHPFGSSRLGCQTAQNELEVKQYQFEKKTDILNHTSELQQPLKESSTLGLERQRNEKTNSKPCSSIELFDGEERCQGQFDRLRCKDRSNEEIVIQGNQTRTVQVVKCANKNINTLISDTMKNSVKNGEIDKNIAKQKSVRRNSAETKHIYKHGALNRDIIKYSVQIQDVGKSNTQHKDNCEVNTLNKYMHTNATRCKDVDKINTQKHICMNDTHDNKDVGKMISKTADRRSRELEATTKPAEKRKRFVLDIGELETFGQVAHRSTYSVVKKIESGLLTINKTFSVAADSTDPAIKKMKLAVNATSNSVSCEVTKASEIKIPADKRTNLENQITPTTVLADIHNNHNIKLVKAGNLDAKTKSSPQTDLADKRANLENQITPSTGLAGKHNNHNIKLVKAGNLEAKTRSLPQTDLAYEQVNLIKKFVGQFTTKKGTLRSGLTTTTGVICPVSGCHGYGQQSLKEHAFSEHIPELFRESNTVEVDEIKTIHRKRMWALGEAASWILKTKGSLDGLVRFFNREKKIPNICIADSVETMKRFCLLNGWNIPSSFTTRPINSVSVLMHWHVLLHCVKYLSVQQRKTFRTLCVKNTKPEGNMQVKQPLDMANNTSRKVLQSHPMLVNDASFDNRKIPCPEQKGSAALTDKKTSNDTSRKTLQNHPMLVNYANFDNRKIACREPKGSVALTDKNKQKDSNKQGTRSFCQPSDVKDETEKTTERESKNKQNLAKTADKENKGRKIQAVNVELTCVTDNKLTSNGSNEQPHGMNVQYKNQSHMQIHTLNKGAVVDTFTHLNQNTGVKPIVFVTVDLVQSSVILRDLENDSARRISKSKEDVHLEKTNVDNQSQGCDRKGENMPVKNAMYDEEKGAVQLFKIKQETPVVCGIKEKRGDNGVASSEQKETEIDLSKPLSSQFEKREFNRNCKAKNDVENSSDIDIKGNGATGIDRGRILIKVDVSIQHDEEDTQCCKSIPINQPRIHTTKSSLKTWNENINFIEKMHKQPDVSKTEEPKEHNIEVDNTIDKESQQHNKPCEQDSFTAVQISCKSEVKKHSSKLPEKKSDLNVKEKVRKHIEGNIDTKIQHHDKSCEQIPITSCQTPCTSLVNELGCDLPENKGDIINVIGKEEDSTEEPYIVYVCPCGKMDTDHDVVFDHFIDHGRKGTIDVVDIRQDNIGFAGEQIEPPEIVIILSDDGDCVILDNKDGNGPRKKSKQHLRVRSDRNSKTLAKTRTYFEKGRTTGTNSGRIENKAGKSLSRGIKDDILLTRQNVKDKQYDIIQTASTYASRSVLSHRHSGDLTKKVKKPHTYNKANGCRHGSRLCNHYKRSVKKSMEKENNKETITLKQNSLFSKTKPPETEHEKVKEKARQTFQALYITPTTERTICRTRLTDYTAETENHQDDISNVTPHKLLYTDTTKTQTTMNVGDESRQHKIKGEIIGIEKKAAENVSRKRQRTLINLNETETANKTSSVFERLGSKKVRITCDETNQDANKASSIHLHKTSIRIEVKDEQERVVHSTVKNELNGKNRSTCINIQTDLADKYKLKHLNSFNGQSLWVDGNPCPVKGCHGDMQKFDNFTAFDNHWRLYHIPVLISKQCSICTEENWRKYNMKKHILDKHGGSGMLIKKEMQNMLYIDPGDTKKYVKQREWMYK